MIEEKQKSKLNFTPTGKLSASRSYHYLYIALAVILPIALIIITLVRHTFSWVTLLFCLVIILVFIGFDIFTTSNYVFYDDTKIALIGSIIEKPVYYEWANCTQMLHGNELGRLEFSDGRKLEYNLKYDGVSQFEEVAHSHINSSDK